ncbi:hypothetical protein [Verrucomicrobium spinosum]|uniref:hypothetical protein n=1 Tax=Verrucomicrobium spinosum TaxID=2736 RepID=UPI000A595780|nr:hypothetical protein [Verrucomicrobium spinosum]
MAALIRRLPTPNGVGEPPGDARRTARPPDLHGSSGSDSADFCLEPMAALASRRERCCGWRRVGPREGTLPDRVEHYHQLLDSWTPRPVASEIHLVLSTGFKDPEAVASGWKWLALGGLHLHAVSGNHHTYIRDESAPTVKVLNQLI